MNSKQTTQCSEVVVLKRKILLKRQAIPLIKDEIVDHQLRLALLLLKGRLEEKMGAEFDVLLSRKLDAVIYLLEN